MKLPARLLPITIWKIKLATLLSVNQLLTINESQTIHFVILCKVMYRYHSCRNSFHTRFCASNFKLKYNQQKIFSWNFIQSQNSLFPITHTHTCIVHVTCILIQNKMMTIRNLTDLFTSIIFVRFLDRQTFWCSKNV